MHKDSEYVYDGKLITDFGLIDLNIINDEKYYNNAIKKGFEGGEYKGHCKKRRYDNFQQGYEKLKKINELEGKVVITRVYECIYCGKWHLTSKTNEEYEQSIKKKESEKSKLRLIKFNAFISRELRYWEKKLKTKKNK